MSSIFGNVDDLYLFSKVVEMGSLQGAAKQLSLPLSTMSRRLTGLESRLNTRLLEKQGRELLPTETGLRVFNQLKSGMEIIESACAQISENRHDVEGKIRLALPHNFYRNFVGEVVEAFLQQYPKVELDLVLSQEQRVPKTDRDLLMTFDISDLDEMIARPLFQAKHGFYASPEYLAKVPKINDLRALTGQSWVSVDHVVDLPVYQGESLIEVMTIKPKLVVNDIIAVMAAVEKGLGVASLPSRYVTPSDNLVQILPQYHRSARQAYLVYKQRRYQPKALSLFIEALMEGVSALKSLNHAS
ncbi:LysR family transcriptional regulator [Vibrio scophthalmi]|uniref:Putative HTH-type transcriptional regulator LtrA n=1 Tax=Vibrio scophthalmi TaxID=45658 RepID=A0A1C7FHV8_9VIBR|nr:LysR family transcriptional regulator [Vibrio scophthalmi]ANU39043.1 putative HTH-type transcriptional regulator LtrA [Vibrio scophthalmi]